jgi:hypothetical protein
MERVNTVLSTDYPYPANNISSLGASTQFPPGRRRQKRPLRPRLSRRTVELRVRRRTRSWGGVALTYTEGAGSLVRGDVVSWLSPVGNGGWGQWERRVGAQPRPGCQRSTICSAVDLPHVPPVHRTAGDLLVRRTADDLAVHCATGDRFAALTVTSLFAEPSVTSHLYLPWPTSKQEQCAGWTGKSWVCPYPLGNTQFFWVWIILK